MRHPASEQFSRVLAARTGRLLEPGHSVEFVENERVFDAVAAEIRKATCSVHLVMYIWKPGRASDQVIAAIEERRRAGVSVRVVVDRFGCRGGFTEEVQPRLEKLGVDVKLFHTPWRTTASKAFSRNHRKILIVDGHRAIVGGFCIWDVFFEDTQDDPRWRDINVRVSGPSVRFMQQAFLQNWTELGGALPPTDELPFPASVEDGLPLTFVHSSGSDPGTVTRARELLRAILPAASKRLWIWCAYFEPTERELELICERARMGIDVRILVPGPIHDVPPIREAGRGMYRRLLQCGARIFEYQRAMMHAKTILVDDALCMVGSINLEPMSLNVLEEGSAVFWSEEHATQLSAAFEADMLQAQEITLTTIPLPELRPMRHGLRDAARWFSHWVRRARRGDRIGTPA